MSLLSLSFAQPFLLWGLIALPVIWWLLRMTPPRPQTEAFPPLKILARVIKREETPHKSPWWLTLLRLLVAAAVILALANPVFNPRDRAVAGGDALAIVLDNGWAAAPDWEERVATAARLIEDARSNDQPVVLALTAEDVNQDIGPFNANTALERLNAAQPRPVPVDRPAVYGRVATMLEDLPNTAIAILSDGLTAAGDEEAFARLFAAGPADILWAVPERQTAVATTDAQNRPNAFIITATRSASLAPGQIVAFASDDQGRRIAETVITFSAGASRASGEMSLPFELRNDFSYVGLDGENHAAAVRVLDENDKRRRVGLISQSDTDQAQPLLSPLFYIRRALSPFADLVEPSSADLTEAIPELLEQNPSVIIMADVGTLPENARRAIIQWVDDGGTLVRFAGPRLAAAENDEALLPVRLRLGERSLGGSLSWTEEQTVAEFPPNGPFSDLSPPRDVVVSRQLLAEPTPDIVERSWANLADGTPIVTGDVRGDGQIVLFHVTPEATWSNLPISGTFVEMLRRVVQLSQSRGGIGSGDNGPVTEALAPYRMISADGLMVPPPAEAEPLAVGERNINLKNPPGLYGSEDGVVAHNLLAPDAELIPLARPSAPVSVSTIRYALDEQRSLKAPLFVIALLALALDTLIVLWLGGQARSFTRRTGAAASVIAIAGLLVSIAPPPANAQNETSAPAQTRQNQTDEARAIAAISETRIAFVITGLASLDATSRAGMKGLSQFLAAKTALEPGEPAGVNIATDELAFYPLIYWPIDPDAAMPSEEAIARVDAYMKSGGTVLFDTRDQYSADLGSGPASPATMRLREILSGLNVPPLEPVPDDHVLTKAFFILPEFAGRYRGSPLWVQATPGTSDPSTRPVRVGDGVSPIMITANDFAGAWAVDADGAPLLPTVPNDPLQRLYAYRAGVNIMMYMLTGNYKSDQVHVPDLLERLGQ